MSFISVIPPTRLLASATHRIILGGLHWGWRERTSIEESDDGVEDRGVARAGGLSSHTYKRSFPYLPRHKHTHTHQHTHAFGLQPPGQACRDLIWSDLRSWFAASCVVTILQARLFPLAPPLLASSLLRFRWCRGVVALQEFGLILVFLCGIIITPKTIKSQKN